MNHRHADEIASKGAPVPARWRDHVRLQQGKVNGDYACGNNFLLNEVLKGDWGYKGWVMSDWGAVPSWDFALKGLDQESGVQLDVKQWGSEAFTDKLRAAYADGSLPRERLSEMVRRILRSMYAVGVDKQEAAPAVDMAAQNQIALDIARQGIVLLKNDGAALPLRTDRPLSIAAIGGHAHKGVISGTGSGAVNPVGGYAGRLNIGGPGTLGAARDLFLFAPSPVEELKKALPQATIEYDPRYTPAEAVLMAERADVVIGFGIRVEGEGFDLADLSLPGGRTPSSMRSPASTRTPSSCWRPAIRSPCLAHKVRAIVQAWLSGQAGAQAIAEIISGKVNPSGRTPITWPASLS